MKARPIERPLVRLVTLDSLYEIYLAEGRRGCSSW